MRQCILHNIWHSWTPISHLRIQCPLELRIEISFHLYDEVMLLRGRIKHIAASQESWFTPYSIKDWSPTDDQRYGVHPVIQWLSVASRDAEFGHGGKHSKMYISFVGLRRQLASGVLLWEKRKYIRSQQASADADNITNWVTPCLCKTFALGWVDPCVLQNCMNHILLFFCLWQVPVKMLSSVLALSAPKKQHQPTHHNIACGLLDVLACKHCRRSRSNRSSGRNSEKDAESSKKCKKKSKDTPKRTSKEPDMVFGDYLSADAYPPKEFSSSRNTHLAIARRHSLSTSDLPDISSRTSMEGISILKTSPASECNRRLPSDSNLKKQARFSESVSVIVHDLDGHQLLKDEVRLKVPDSPDGQTLVCPNYVDPKKHLEKPFEIDSMEVDHRNGLGFLKVVVYLGIEYINDRVEIHSGKLGQSLVIIAYKLEPLGDGTNYYKRYMQKFRLSEPVNPFAIEARLLRDGYVKIRAPLASLDDDDDEHSPRENSWDPVETNNHPDLGQSGGTFLLIIAHELVYARCWCVLSVVVRNDKCYSRECTYFCIHYRKNEIPTVWWHSNLCIVCSKCLQFQVARHDLTHSKF